ncbi:GPW/gp25 family protein [Paracoccus sp. MBLB3053]|uniref:GPW/gp25 family protein n=1 Tax=Paracoccus aurantius TaxID=3073814 RepID=A0ABU2HYJ0_9RHOB|nr:GPW/gp25 family protein [Paracoccus sp. MBLB3053]MDS9470128.1 GPW/gp25 family protein [Paracoccus sp. MBLB3053]
MTGIFHTDYPYRLASDGMTARTRYEDHVRDLIEQLLFTRPGERLVRPALGCGLADLLFAPLTPESADAARTAIDLALQRHLAQEIELRGLDVRMEGSALFIDIRYRIRATGSETSAEIVVEGLA